MIKRILEVHDQQEMDRLWDFYDDVFRPLNEDTPITQTFPKNIFQIFLTSPQVIKFVAEEGGSIKGIGFITDQMKLEPLLSPLYFAKHCPGKKVYHIPALAVAPDKRGVGLAAYLVRAMIKEVPEDGVIVFFHSIQLNPIIPRFVKLANAFLDYEGGEVDELACLVYTLKNNKAPIHS